MSLKQRLARLERESGASQAPITIRILYENGLDGTTELAPWHIRIDHQGYRVVHGERVNDAEL